jgi:hypothetical protein
MDYLFGVRCGSTFHRVRAKFIERGYRECEGDSDDQRSPIDGKTLQMQDLQTKSFYRESRRLSLLSHRKNLSLEHWNGGG